MNKKNEHDRGATLSFVIYQLSLSSISSTAQGGGSFKNRKPIGEVGCRESRMAERIHWWTERWLELCFFPTTLCGVLVFDSVSRAPSPPPAASLSHTHTLGDIHLRFTWPNSHLLSFCVAGVAQTHIHRRFAWPAWHSWHWVARLDWLGRPWCHGTLRGTTSQLLSFHVAGVAQMALGGALGVVHTHTHIHTHSLTHTHLVTSTFVSRGQTHIYRRFAWSAWHSWHWVARLDWLGRPWRRGTLRGRRGTTLQLLSFCVAGVAQTHIHRRSAWPAWHSWHWVARLDWLGRPWRRGTLRGRRGTTLQLLSFHVAGVAQTHIHRRFAWQAWYRWHWVARLEWFTHTHTYLVTSTFVSRGQTHIYCRFAWQAWHKLTSTVVLRGRRGTHGTGWRAWTGLGARDAAAVCVAGVAQSHIHLRLAWQAWHKLTSTFVSRGRRGTQGTQWRAWTWFGRPWRPWRRGILRGRRGTISHPPSFCVAGVAQSHAQLCHAHTHTHTHTYIRTYVRTYIHTYMHTIFSHTFTYSLSPPPLFFLPSPSPLQPLKLSIGRSWLVGLSGPWLFW